MLKQTQDEILEWSTRNFGRPVKLISSPETLLLAMTHLGSAAHSFLKASQNIRGSVTQHESEYISAANLLMSRAEDMRVEEFSAEMPDISFDLSSFIGIMEEIGELANALLNENDAEVEDAVADTMVYLLDFCGRNNKDSEKLLTAVWSKVKQRDWKKNAATGEVAAS